MKELTDDQVMAAPTPDVRAAPATHELSDADVMKPKADRPEVPYSGGIQNIAEANPTGYFGGIAAAFKSGAEDGYGNESYGLSEANKKLITDSTGPTFKAFDEKVLFPAMEYLDSLWRTPNSILHGIGDAAIAAGLPRDMVSLLEGEAFYGSPHPTGNFSTPKLEKPRVEGGEPPGPPGAPPIAAEMPTPHDRIAEATDLGVIGPEKPRLSEGTPEQAVEATKPKVMAAESDNPWQQRFENFVSKINKPEDVQQLILDASDENGGFVAARQGEIPLAQQESLAEAAGVAPDTVDVSGAGRLMRNDAQVRIGMQTMLEATEQVKEAARNVKADGSPESLIALQEAMMRRDLAVEQIVGLRSEWGRTGNVFQEFLRDVKDQESLTSFLKDKGRTPQDLHDIANGIDQLDRTQAARVLSDMHSKAPSLWYWSWVQGLISGPLTHTKYIAANAVYTVMENGITPALASVIGKAKSLFGSEVDHVYFGEPMAATYGMLAAIPDAIKATAKSIYSGQRTVLHSEIELHRAAIERGEKVPPIIDRAVNQVFGQGKPEVFSNSNVWGRLQEGDVLGAGKDALGRVLGAPGDAAMGIHTFFKILGERAGLRAEAYRAAVKEGHDPQTGQFWNRFGEISENPTEDMQSRAVAGAYKGTFMSELGPRGKAAQRFVKETPGLKWVFPFMHIPINLVKATYEHLPLALLDGDMRADIMGKNGGVKQDKAIARMVVGSSIMGYFVNAGLNGRATGDYPSDPKERDAWKLQGKMPNSLLIGNTWVSISKFGPMGDLANLGANIAAIVPTLTGGEDDSMTKGTWMAAEAASRMLVDEVGFQMLANIFDAMHDEKKGVALAASVAATRLPYSSMLRQTASYNDPYMRKVAGFFDGIKNAIPGERQTIMPQRDNFGAPVPNPQFGNILRQREAITDPVNMEMARLQIHPGLPSDRIGGVKMTPEMYDRYQSVAGPFTKQALDNIVNSPDWASQPDYAKEMTIRATIAATRKAAAGAMQAANPDLIQQGVQQRIDHITGTTHTDRPKVAPPVPANQIGNMGIRG